MIKKLSESLQKEILKAPNQVIGLITGLWSLWKHLKKWRMFKYEPISRQCLQEEVLALYLIAKYYDAVDNTQQVRVI